MIIPSKQYFVSKKFSGWSYDLRLEYNSKSLKSAVYAVVEWYADVSLLPIPFRNICRELDKISTERFFSVLCSQQNIFINSYGVVPSCGASKAPIAQGYVICMSFCQYTSRIICRTVIDKRQTSQSCCVIIRECAPSNRNILTVHLTLTPCDWQFHRAWRLRCFGPRIGWYQRKYEGWNTRVIVWFAGNRVQ